MTDLVTQTMTEALTRLKASRASLDAVGKMSRDELEELTGALQRAVTPFLPELVETPAKPYDLSDVTADGRGFPILFRTGTASELTLFLVERGTHCETGEPLSDFVEVAVSGDTRVALTFVYFREVALRWDVKRIVEAIFERCRRGVNGVEKKKAQLDELVARLKMTRRIIWDHYLTNDPTPRFNERKMTDE